MEASEFLSVFGYGDDIVELRLLPSAKSLFIKRNEIDPRKVCEDHGGENIYFGVNARSKPGGKSDADVKHACAVFVDIDGLEDLQYVLNAIDDASLPGPSVVVESGRGLHVYWLLDEPITDLDQWRRLQKGIIRKLEHLIPEIDSKIHNPSRIMRLPGSVNQKNGKMCRVILANPNTQYALIEFPELHETPGIDMPGLAEGSVRLCDIALSDFAIKTLNGKVKKGERNQRFFTLACELKARGVAFAEAHETVVRAALRSGLELKETESLMRQAYAKERTIRVSLPDDTIQQLSQDDVTDHIIEGKMPSAATEHVKKVVTVAPQPPKVDLKVQQVRNAYKRFYVNDKGDAKNVVTIKRIHEITDDVLRICDGWPKRVNNQLFVIEQNGDDYRIRYLSKPQDLFAWLHAQVPIYWHEGEGSLAGERDVQSSTVSAVTKMEFFDHLVARVPDEFQSISSIPHQPPMSGVFYTPCTLPKATGRALDEFVSMFNVASEEDRLLLKAAICTPAWGGEPGTRPGFIFEASQPGSGKTSAVNAISEIFGGSHMVGDPKMTWENVMKSMFSGPSAHCRIITFDNVKGIVAGEAIESAITAPFIGGWRVYVGQIVRKNDCTVFVTSNNAETGADMAQRVVVIRMGNPIKGVDWAGRMRAFIDSRRLEVLADVLDLLSRPSLYTVDQMLGDRFGGWQAGVLAKIQGADRLSKMIAERRDAVDGDAKRGDDVLRLIYDHLVKNSGASRMVEVPAYRIWVLLVENGIWENRKRLDVDAKGIGDCAKWLIRKTARYGTIVQVAKTSSGNTRRCETPCLKDENRTVKSTVLTIDLSVLAVLFGDEETDVRDRNGQAIPF